MKVLSSGLLFGGIALLPAGAFAQSGVQDCRERVADSLNVGSYSVQVSQGRNGENGNPTVDWEADVSGHRIRGFCETNRNGRAISAQLGRGFGGGGKGRDNYSGGGGGGVPNNGGGSVFPGGSQGGGAVISVNVDTAGNGNFSGMGQNVRITRGWVDTRNKPSISLSGDGNFKITFTGNVTAAGGQDREFTIRINDSSRGNATGTATVRLNPARDEVEAIRVDARVGNGQVTGTFTR
jgi:hypothetical protein